MTVSVKELGVIVGRLMQLATVLEATAANSDGVMRGRPVVFARPDALAEIALGIRQIADQLVEAMPDRDVEIEPP